YTVSGVNYHGFRWRNGVLTDLSLLVGGDSLGQAINAGGDIVGQMRLDFSSTGTRAVWWPASGGAVDVGGWLANSSDHLNPYSILNGINNNGEMVGWRYRGGGDASPVVFYPDS